MPCPFCIVFGINFLSFDLLLAWFLDDRRLLAVTPSRTTSDRSGQLLSILDHPREWTPTVGEFYLLTTPLVESKALKNLKRLQFCKKSNWFALGINFWSYKIDFVSKLPHNKTTRTDSFRLYFRQVRNNMYTNNNIKSSLFVSFTLSTLHWSAHYCWLPATLEFLSTLA